MLGEETTVTVLPLSGVGRGLAYRVDEKLSGQVQVGSLVRIPLGRRSELGVVVRLGDDGQFERKRMKHLYGLEQPFPVVREDGIRLAEWMAGYYSCGMEQVLEVMIPRAVRRGMRQKEERFLALEQVPEAEELEQLARRAPQQHRVVSFLSQQAIRKAWARGLLLKRLKVSATVLDGLVEKGLLKETREAAERVAYGDGTGDLEQISTHGFTLTEEQAAAARQIQSSLEAGGFGVHLLHGVTGSGKTEVYIQAIR